MTASSERSDSPFSLCGWTNDWRFARSIALENPLIHLLEINVEFIMNNECLYEGRRAVVQIPVSGGNI